MAIAVKRTPSKAEKSMDVASCPKQIKEPVLLIFNKVELYSNIISAEPL